MSDEQLLRQNGLYNQQPQSLLTSSNQVVLSAVALQLCLLLRSYASLWWLRKFTHTLNTDLTDLG